MLQVLSSHIMTNKNIAIIGGTFDPVHIGHIKMAEYLADNKLSDEIWLLPSYNSPHKDIDTIKSFENRINMLKIAFNSYDNIVISRYEEEYAKNISNTKTYTYEILNSLQNKYKDITIHFVVGFDSIKNINTWHRYLELINDYEFYIFDRVDFEFKTFEQKKFYLDNLGAHQNIKFRYKFFDCNIPNISSTSLRSLLKNKNDFKNVLNIFLDKNVLKYIEENNLYM